jgi:RNA polymerase sigma-70 factor (ECF subfamily)
MNVADQFEALASAYYEPLFRFALSLTSFECDARDLTQQTFYVWAAKGHQLRDSSKAKSWLFTTLHRLFIGTQRRKNRFSYQDLETAAEQLPHILPELTERADYSEVISALAKLDEIYQAAVALFYLEDYSYKDIADILEIPLGTVQSRIARGIAQLRHILLPTDNPAPRALAKPIPTGTAFKESAPGFQGSASSRCLASRR